MFVAPDGPGTLTHQVVTKSGGNARWCLWTTSVQAAVDIPGTVADARDNITVEQSRNTPVFVSLTSDPHAPARTAKLTIGCIPRPGQLQRRFELTKVDMSRGDSLRFGVAGGGDELVIYNQGPSTQFALRALAGPAATQLRLAVTIAAGKTVRIQPADWNVNTLGHTTLRMHISDPNSVGRGPAIDF